MSVIGSNVLAGASGGAGAAAGFQISRSVRLNSSDSAYFSRTPSSAGNRKTWTWSGWIKVDGNFANRNLNYGGNIFFGTHDGQPLSLIHI